MMCGLNQLMERKECGGMYLLWVSLIGDVRTLMMDEAHASRYLVNSGADKTYYDLRDMYGGHVWRRILLPISWWKIYFEALVDIAEGIENTAKTCVRLTTLKRIDKKYLADTNLHVHLEEIKVDKTLRFVEEPVEIIEREVKSLKRSRNPILSLEVLIKSRDEISLRRGYCDNCALSSYKSIERDRLMVIEVMVAMDISLYSHFSDNENDVACRDLEAAFEYPGERYEGVEVCETFYACSDSLLLTPLCCDDIQDVTPRVSALARCDKTVPQQPQWMDLQPHRHLVGAPLASEVV
ncbi:hypothetical protein Tco_1335885 [Tanacetum coccineum]